MKQSVKIALLSGAAGVLSMGAVAVTSIARAATTDTTATTSSTVDTAVTTPSTNTSTPPMMGDRHGMKLDDMAAALGITTTQLQTELDSGKQFYQIAAEHGVTYDQLKSQQDTKVKAQLDDMVKVGYLTQAEADQQWSTYQTKAQDMPMIGIGPHGMF